MRKVTVIMSTYGTNDEYLKKSITSILNQTYKNLEFIIVVDGDPDNLRLVEKFKDDRIKIINNKTNIGLPHSLNKALDAATGDYIARMDADDISLLNRIERQVEYLDEHSNIDAVGTFSRKFGESNRLFSTPYINSEDVAAELSFRCILDHPTMMFRASFIHDNHFRYNTNFEVAQDYELWSRMIKVGKIAIAPFIGIKIRVHGNQASSRKRKLQQKNARRVIRENVFICGGSSLSRNDLLRLLLLLNSNEKIEKAQYVFMIKAIKEIKKGHPKLAGHMLVRLCNICIKNKTICSRIFSFTYVNYVVRTIFTNVKLWFPYKTPKKNIGRVKKFLIKFLLKMDEKRIISLNDKIFIKMKYMAKTGYNAVNLEFPVSFNEKIQWLKLYNREDIYTKMVDKKEVKEYVANQIGGKYVVPTLGIYDKFEDIDFAALPNQFVIKCTHDSGGLVVVSDKRDFDIKNAKRVINKSLKKNFYYCGREWPYKNVKPRIIVEKYLEDDSDGELRDYKLFCFDGKYRMMFIATNRQGVGETYFDFFDHDFRHLPFTNGHPHAPTEPHKPANLKKMIELAEILSKGIPHVRVDFYEVNGEIFFGEMTFYHFSGFTKFEPEEWDRRLGDLIDLSLVKNEK